MRFGESTTPSRMLRRPARSSLSSSSLKNEGIFESLDGPSTVMTRSSTISSSSSAAVARTCFSSSRCFSLSPLLTVSTMLLSSASIVFVGFRLGTRSVGGLLSADEPRDGARWPSARSPAEECPRTTVLVVVVVTDCEPLRFLTTLLAASTSSITKIRRLKSIGGGVEASDASSMLLPPFTVRKTRSNITSISSWFVLILLSGTLTIWRLV
mmetsp:Transcript_18752/g.40423  ORF Transcript_18752/g.40423 Transcript_18752/m.40423 type:complete len:211 (+) Transcript_18752:1134-1766(+)